MYRALVSFSGVISMAKDEVREITNKETVKDLLKAGYIEQVKATDTKELQKENARLDKELQEAYAKIEELNQKIAELEAPVADAENEGEETPTGEDETPTGEDETPGNENSDENQVEE